MDGEAWWATVRLKESDTTQDFTSLHFAEEVTVYTFQG